MNRTVRLLRYVIAGLVAILLFNRFTTGSWGVDWSRRTDSSLPPPQASLDFARPAAPAGFPTTARAGNGPRSAPNPSNPSAESAPPSRLAVMLERLARNSDPAMVRSNEAVVMFATDTGFLRFLGESPSGLTIAGRIRELRAVRLQIDDVAALGSALEAYRDEIDDVSPNSKMFLALPRSTDEPAAGVASQLPHLLGIDLATVARGGESVRDWGRGFLVALLDTGVDPAGLPDPRRVEGLDVGWGILPASHHGTSLANLVAGFGGVAPGAAILAVRVTDADQVSDIFAVAQGMVEAMKAGASVIEVSPSSPVDSALLTNAVELVDANSVTVIASTGGAARSWPAADRHVIGINSIVGPRVPINFDGAPVPQLTQGSPAIALGITLPDGGAELVAVDSPASATIVAGAMAAVLSSYPRLTPAQAWTTLQQYAAAPDAVTANVEGLYSVGYQVLNLGWINAPSDNRPQRPETPVRGRGGFVARTDARPSPPAATAAAPVPPYRIVADSPVSNPGRPGANSPGRGSPTSRDSTSGRGNATKASPGRAGP